MMRKVNRFLGTLFLVITLITGSTITANAAIYNGGSGVTGGSGSRGVDYAPYWRVAKTIDQYTNTEVLGRFGATAGAVSHESGWSASDLNKALKNTQPSCIGTLKEPVLAVFVQEIGPNSSNPWRQAVLAVNSGYSAIFRSSADIPPKFKGGQGLNTYSKLLAWYKANGGSDSEVIRQMTKEGDNALPNRAIICVTKDPTYVAPNPTPTPAPTPTPTSPGGTTPGGGTSTPPATSPDPSDPANPPVVTAPTSESRTLEENKVDVQYNFKYRSEETPDVIVCDYSATVAVQRQISVNGKDPIGVDNLHDQPAAMKKTKYGEIYDKIVSGELPKTEATWNQLQTACDEDATSFVPPKVDLTEQNQKGLAEGGVLNVTEQRHQKRMEFSKTVEYLESCTRTETISDRKLTQTRTRASETDPWGEWTPDTFGPWTVHPSTTTTLGAVDCQTKVADDKGKDWIKYTTLTGDSPTTENVPWTTEEVPPTSKEPVITIIEGVPPTPYESGFWQIISVHCNEEDFNNLVTATGATVVSEQADTSGYITAVAYSKKYEQRPSASGGRLDFGDSGNPTDTPQYRSSLLAFYDKECAFECTATPQAGSSNGSADNVRNTDPTGNGTGTVRDGWGATSQGVNDNKFEFFRDNIEKDIKVDVWYPKNANGVTYDNTEAKTTTITKWGQGTPNPSTGGTFVMTTKDGTEIFDPEKDNRVPVQRNWETKEVTTKDVAVLSGQENEFKVKADWASETGYPHALNVKWEYAPTVETKVAIGGLGFNPDGTAAFNAPSSVTAPIEGRCYAEFGTNNGTQKKQEFQDNTGSGRESLMDTKLPTAKELDNTDTSIIQIKFVRSTTE